MLTSNKRVAMLKFLRQQDKKIKVIFAGIGSLVFVGALSFQSFLQTTSASINVSNQLISFDYTNTQNGDGQNRPAHISDDGKKVIFNSGSTDVIANDSNGTTPDLVMRDIDSSTTELINKTYQNQQTPQTVTMGSVSENGRYVVFSTSQAGMTATTTSYNEIYLRDTDADTTELISTNSAGVPANNTSDDVYGVSNDGRFVLFRSLATNLIDGQSSYPVPQGQIFIKDRLSGKAYLISQSESGVNGNSNSNGGAQMSCDGAFAIFSSSSSNLTPNDTNGKTDIFLVDLRNGFRIKNITESYNGISGGRSISCNGNYIIFSSNASNIVSGVSGYHLYAYERLTGDVNIIDQSTNGNISNAGVIFTGNLKRMVSNDGRVVFTSQATNLVSSHSIPTGSGYVYLRDIKAETTEIISINSSGQLANAYNPNADATISANGKKIAYSTAASNIVPAKTDTRSGVILVTID